MGLCFAAVVLQRSEIRVNAGDIGGSVAGDGGAGCILYQIVALRIYAAENVWRGAVVGVVGNYRIAKVDGIGGAAADDTAAVSRRRIVDNG